MIARCIQRIYHTESRNIPETRNCNDGTPVQTDANEFFCRCKTNRDSWILFQLCDCWETSFLPTLLKNSIWLEMDNKATMVVLMEIEGLLMLYMRIYC